MKDDLNLYKEVLFFKHSNSIATPQEEAAIQDLLTNTEEACMELDLVKTITAIDKDIQELKSCDTSKGYAGMQQKVKEHKKPFHLTVYLNRIAVILILPLIISTCVLMYINLNQKEELNRITWLEVSSAPGLVSRFELPDKSKVWLNSESVLRYPSRFESNERNVELRGEGYFEVKSDKKCPFYVTTGDGMKVMAYGTRFNVNAYDEYKELETVLEEGKVDILFSGKPPLELNPGEQVSFNKESRLLTVKHVNPYEKTAWKDGKVIFRNASLKEVFKLLSRRYNVDIIFHDDYKLSEGYRCRVSFTNETIQQIFNYLEVAAPIKWAVSYPVQQSDSSLAKQRIDVWLKKK